MVSVIFSNTGHINNHPYNVLEEMALKYGQTIADRGQCNHIQWRKFNENMNSLLQTGDL